MRKLIFTLSLAAFTISLNANPVSKTTAQHFALQFYGNTTGNVSAVANLFWADTSPSGDTLYYVFNINQNDGFVIVSADDAAHPLIGYATTGKFVAPGATSTVGLWLGKRKNELMQIRSGSIAGTSQITKEWALTGSRNVKAGAKVLSAGVAPLVQSTWNQSPYYNDQCPSSSVTGCVATAMAQIMRYWSYPPRGTGSSSYCDCKSAGFSNDYGTQAANYGATTYNWPNMPLAALTAANSDVALLNYQCGVSVNMDYSPSGSGAFVITADDTICAQHSFVTYFGYNAKTIQGLQRKNYSDSVTWKNLIENELNNGRPVQYVGQDPKNGGHTWVCDGYDASECFHMNWGWGGADNGYYSINSLNPSIYTFSQTEEALIGIQPPPRVSVDAGISSIISPGTSGSCSNTLNVQVSFSNYGIDTITSCTLNYTVDGGAVVSQAWTGQLDPGASTTVSLAAFTTTAGSHTLICSTDMPNGVTDGNPSNDASTVNFFDNSSGAAVPFSEGFEGSSNLPLGWTLNDPNGSVSWQVVSGVSFAGTNCIGYNNCDGAGSADMTGMVGRFVSNSYDFSGASLGGSVSFEVAYDPCQFSGGSAYTDTLAVYYSMDCGTTWNNVYVKGGTKLSTVTPYFTGAGGVSCWAPSNKSQWRLDSISIPALAGQSSVQFAFENRSDFGQWIYLDNINIRGLGVVTTGIAGLSSGNGEIGLYPNPASGNVTISGSKHTGLVHFSMFDVSGREVSAGLLDAEGDGFKATLSVTGMNKGMYFIRVFDDKDSWISKLVVQ